MSDVQELELHERLAGLVRFLAVFEEPGFSFGSWSDNGTDADGALIMSSYVLSDEAAAFVRTAYDLGWIISFDWPEWKGTADAERLRDDPETLASATLEQLEKLLTACIRQDRFVEGGFAAEFESGLLSGILRRAEALLREG